MAQRGKHSQPHTRVPRTEIDAVPKCHSDHAEHTGGVGNGMRRARVTQVLHLGWKVYVSVFFYEVRSCNQLLWL